LFSSVALDSRPLLLVEDDVQDTELFLLACRELDLQDRIVCLPDAAKAWQVLREARDDVRYPRSLPAVAIIDLRMPGMDGVDFLRAVRTDERLRALPVVVLSSSEEPADVNTCYELGANGYVVKPVDFRRFLSTVQTLVQFWLLVNEPLK